MMGLGVLSAAGASPARDVMIGVMTGRSALARGRSRRIPSTQSLTSKLTAPGTWGLAKSTER